MKPGPAHHTRRILNRRLQRVHPGDRIIACLEGEVVKLFQQAPESAEIPGSAENNGLCIEKVYKG